MEYLWLLSGFVLLVIGGDILIRGGTRLSTLLGVSPLLVGLGVAAFGTSAPEAAVSIKAATSGYSAISIGNVLGSNIANIGLAIGIALLIFGIKENHAKIRKEITFGFIATALLFILALLSYWQTGSWALSRSGGFILLTFFSGYLYYLYRMSKKDKAGLSETESFKNKKVEYLKSILLTLGGIGGVIAGGEFVVTNAVKIADSLGASQTLISVTVVALGTSLPEIVVSIMAVRKNQWDMALGNILGSNLFNILFVLGTTAAISPIRFDNFSKLILPDMLIAIAITGMLFFFIARKNAKAVSLKTSKFHGLILLVIYFGYVAYAFLR